MLKPLKAATPHPCVTLTLQPDPSCVNHPTLQLGRNAVRCLLAGGTALLQYCLLLVVVTFNLGLLLSAVLGVALGSLAFGEPRALGCERWAVLPPVEWLQHLHSRNNLGKPRLSSSEGCMTLCPFCAAGHVAERAALATAQAAAAAAAATASAAAHPPFMMQRSSLQPLAEGEMGHATTV